MVPYSKPKPNTTQRSKNDNQLSNQLTNSTDVLDNGEDLVTQNDLEAFASQMTSSFTPSATA